MLTKEQIEQYLAEIDAELEEAGLAGEIVLCGGAVMACVYEARPSTKDVDALFEPTRELRDIAARIAARHELEEDWLNDAAKAFIDTSRMRFETVSKMPALTIMRLGTRGQQGRRRRCLSNPAARHIERRRAPRRNGAERAQATAHSHGWVLCQRDAAPCT